MSSRELVDLFGLALSAGVLVVGALQLFVTPTGARWLWSRERGDTWPRRVGLAVGAWLVAWFVMALGLSPAALLSASRLHDGLVVGMWVLLPALLIAVWQPWIVRRIGFERRRVRNCGDLKGFIADDRSRFEAAYQLARRRARFVVLALLLVPSMLGALVALYVEAVRGDDRLVLLMIAVAVAAPVVARAGLEIVNRADPTAFFLAWVVGSPPAEWTVFKVTERLAGFPWDPPVDRATKRHRVLLAVPAASLALQRGASRRPGAVRHLEQAAVRDLLGRLVAALNGGADYRDEWMEVRRAIFEGKINAGLLPDGWRPPGIWSANEFLVRFAPSVAAAATIGGLASESLRELVAAITASIHG